MLLPDIYWIRDILEGNLAIMPKPRSNEWLEDEIKSFHNQGVNIIVCLLTANEVYELELQSEQILCEQYHIEYISVTSLNFFFRNALLFLNKALQTKR